MSQQTDGESEEQNHVFALAEKDAGGVGFLFQFQSSNCIFAMPNRRLHRWSIGAPAIMMEKLVTERHFNRYPQVPF